MKAMKRIVMVFLGILFVFSLVACSQGVESDPVIPLDINTEASADEKPTLNIHLQASGYSETELNQQYAAKVISEITDYNVHYSQLPATGDTEALDLALINRSQYHAIKVTKEQYNRLVAQGALLNIKPALDKFGQDIYDAYYDYSWSIVSKDGGIYGIPEGGPPIKGQTNVIDCIIFRKDLLDSWQKHVPETTEEFEELLRYAKTEQGIQYPFVMTDEKALVPTIAVAFDIYQEWQGDNGDYHFYPEDQNMKSYLDYMISLNNQGLLTPDSLIYDKADAVRNFGEGKAVAVAVSVYEVDAILSTLINSGIIASDKDPEEVLSVVGGFEDSNGEVHTYHTGGYSYVTVIPKYMYEEAGYTIDHINKKIIEENFKRYYIGEEGVHYTVTSGPDGDLIYRPIEGKFDELNSAAGFCTGTNPKASPPLWRCRVYNKEYLPFLMTLNENSDAEGTYNPMNFTSELPTYDQVKGVVEQDACDACLNMIFTQKSSDGLTAALNTWLNAGGRTGKQELAAWAKDNWEGKVKVE